MKILHRVLPALTLLEWGVILSYFYFSGRIASFLHPMFRPWVLVTGILLVLTALCVGFFPEDTCTHEHEHEHDHSHARLTLGSVIAFFLLLIPLALATKISPDSYGADLIRRRGLVEDIRSLPGMSGRVSSVVAVTKPTLPASLSAQAAVVQQSIARTAALREKNPQLSMAKNLEEAAQEPIIDPALPTQTSGNEDAGPPPPNDGTFQNPALQLNHNGNIPVQVTDLLYAAQDASTRKDFEGKRIEIIGQFLPPKKGATKQKLAPNSFMLVRLVMVCCAADMMPAAVKVEDTKGLPHLRDTSWLKVVGRLHYRPRPKGPGADGIDYGDTPEPVVVADSVSKTPTPAEKYVY